MHEDLAREVGVPEREPHENDEARELDVPGLIRRVRRLLNVGQRGLAKLLGVSAALVGHWEAGVRDPGLRIFQRLLHLGGFQISITDAHGAEAIPMGAPDVMRDRGGRQYPAHRDMLPTTDDDDILRISHPRRGEARTIAATFVGAGDPHARGDGLERPEDDPSTYQHLTVRQVRDFRLGEIAIRKALRTRDRVAWCYRRWLRKQEELRRREVREVEPAQLR